MTTASTHDHVRALFDDARRMQAQAQERLSQGDIRDAAEKAWCATKRATDALVLSRTGEEPPPSGTGQTVRHIRRWSVATTRSATSTAPSTPALARQSDTYETLVGRYFTRISYLHGTCFYTGLCGPDTQRRILETVQYIDAAEALAAG